MAKNAKKWHEKMRWKPHIRKCSGDWLCYAPFRAPGYGHSPASCHKDWMIRNGFTSIGYS